MQRVELEVKPRDLGDKKVTRNLSQLRKEGWIPGTLYGHGDPVSIAVNHRSLEKAVKGSKAGLNALFNVKAPEGTTLAVIKEVQRHFLRQTPLHVDFLRINVKDKLEVTVPVHTVGDVPGVKNSGGILEYITREIRVKCLPDDIPASIDVDGTKLELNDEVKVKDLPAIKGVEYLSPAEAIVVHVVAPKVEEVKPAAGAEGAAAGAAAGEPEVIAKGKKEEEGAAAAGAKPAAGGKAPAAAAPAKKDEKKK